MAVLARSVLYQTLVAIASTDDPGLFENSFIGLILVTHSDSLLTSSLSIAPSDSLLDSSSPIHEPHVRRPILGDMLALLSAFCYAVYVILLKVRIGDEERVDMQLFFG